MKAVISFKNVLGGWTSPIIVKVLKQTNNLIMIKERWWKKSYWCVKKHKNFKYEIIK